MNTMIKKRHLGNSLKNQNKNNIRIRHKEEEFEESGAGTADPFGAPEINPGF